MLTIDAGNSKLKWGLWVADNLVKTGEIAYESSAVPGLNKYTLDTPMLDRQWSDITHQDCVVFSSVADDDIRKEVTQWLSHHWASKPLLFKSQKEHGRLRNSYRDVSQMGDDRWAANIGACYLHAPPLCIIDVGTAVTVDLVDQSWQHIGGRILPGEQMMKDSLLERAPGIGNIEGKNVAWACNTADAVSSGTRRMLQAALGSIIEEARQELGNDMRCVLSGGGADMFNVADNPEVHGMTVHREPHLILYGLHVYGIEELAETPS